MAAVGKKINEYTIIRQLSVGSFCTSYGVQEKGVTYFLKEYSGPTKLCGEYIPFLNNQNTLIKRLNKLGRNIEKIVDSFEIKRYYQVKEFIYGINLKDWMCDHTSFNVRKSLAIKICEVVSDIHNVGIVHQDLKPEQIMVIADGSSEFGFNVILTDFDWSVPDGKVVKYVGTNYYSKVDDSISHKTDILPLGIIITELLVGRTPYNIDYSLALDEDESTEYWKNLVRDKKYTAPISINPVNISSEASNIIVKCLDPEPSGRPEIKYIIEALKAEKYSFKPIISTILIPTPSLDASVSVHITVPSPSLSKRIASIDVFDRVVGGVKEKDVILVKKPEFIPLDGSIKLQSPFSKLLQKNKFYWGYI